MSLYKTINEHEKVIGAIASTMAVVMFVSLIEVLNSNIAGKSDIFIQPAATAFNGFFWSLYAISKKDKFLLIPNLLALALGIITALSVFI